MVLFLKNCFATGISDDRSGVPGSMAGAGSCRLGKPVLDYLLLVSKRNSPHWKGRIASSCHNNEMFVSHCDIARLFLSRWSNNWHNSNVIFKNWRRHQRYTKSRWKNCLRWVMSIYFSAQRQGTENLKSYRREAARRSDLFLLGESCKCQEPIKMFK